MEFNISAHKRASLKLRELHDGEGKPDSVCMLPNLLLAIGWGSLSYPGSLHVVSSIFKASNDTLNPTFIHGKSSQDVRNTPELS